MSIRWVAAGILIPLVMILARWGWHQLKVEKVSLQFVYQVGVRLVLFFILVPFLFYFASHIIIPIIYHRDFSTVKGCSLAIQDILDYQKNMLHYHLVFRTFWL